MKPTHVMNDKGTWDRAPEFKAWSEKGAEWGMMAWPIDGVGWLSRFVSPKQTLSEYDASRASFKRTYGK